MINDKNQFDIKTKTIYNEHIILKQQDKKTYVKWSENKEKFMWRNIKI